MRRSRDVAVTGVLTALTFVTVMFARVPMPTGVLEGGLVHLGNAPVFIAAIVFGKKTAAFAGGAGMALFNLLIAPGPHWAPFTLVTRGAMGYVVGAIAARRGGKSPGMNLLAIGAGGLVFIAGMYLSEVLLLRFGMFNTDGTEFVLLVPLSSIPGNLAQVVLSTAVTLPVLGRLRAFRRRFYDAE